MSLTSYPKRLIEVDLPIARISAHARKEKAIKRGHISTLHIWWARRPLAACRAVICAALWPDPVDLSAWLEKGEEVPAGDSVIRPARFLETAQQCMIDWGKRHLSKVSPESYPTFIKVQQGATAFDNPTELRRALLDFIADFANWDNSTDKTYLETARKLTQAAYEALGGEEGSRPLVADPFAGGGAFPLEAARIGASSFGGDLNPLSSTLNKVLLECAPKYGAMLTSEVEKWGGVLEKQIHRRLEPYYPKEPDNRTAIAYFWARTIRCEGPACGVQVPIVRSFQFGTQPGNEAAVQISYQGKKLTTKIVIGKQAKSVHGGTSKRSSVTCPRCGYTTPRKNVEVQANANGFGLHLFAVGSRGTSETRKTYREPIAADFRVIQLATQALRKAELQKFDDELSLVPNEELPYLRSIFNVRVYGIDQWAKLFTPRQLIAAVEQVQAVRDVARSIVAETDDRELADAVITCLALIVSNSLQYQCSIATYLSDGIKSAFIQGQSLGMKMDFVEANPLIAELVGGFDYSLQKTLTGLEYLGSFDYEPGEAFNQSALTPFLPDGSTDLIATDPPYYDVIPYADCSDFFHVWLHRMLHKTSQSFFVDSLSRKDEEIVQLAERNEKYRARTKEWFEQRMRDALAAWRRVTKPDGKAVIVFAHKETKAWEALLSAVLDAGWIITASWPLDTENSARMRANESAVLSSSIHLVCEPRENLDGSLRGDVTGDWRDVLVELPRRIHEWMPRLAEEGVVGADAIFACLGPALEIFSRYSRVEKSSGEAVPLREYLEQVWAAVSKEALSMIFKDADTAGLEPDARLTAMWLWTLGGGASVAEPGGEGEAAEAENDNEESGKAVKTAGFVLEFDAARKIAQGLGIHLDKASSVVEVKGETARLLSVAERTKYLFGKEADDETAKARRKKKEPAQQSLFAALEAAENSAGAASLDKVQGPKRGTTVLDQVHQAMILFAAGRGEAMKRFLVEEGVGKDARFWKLAQSLSALYPPGGDEKRWVDGVLARKKGLGL